MPRPKKPGNQGGYQPGQNPGGAPAQAPAAPTGLPYGQHKQLVDAQRQIPLPDAGTAPPSQQPAPGGGQPGLAEILQAAQQMRPPGGSLRDPSMRPNEPTTAGLPIGAGPGPEALGIPAEDPALADLKLVYQMTGIEEVRQIIERYERERLG